MRIRISRGNVYHVLNRGVDKRKIFLDEEDYLRFIHDLFEFNDTESVNNFTYYFLNNKSKYKDVGRPYAGRKPKKPLVEIIVFCLMPNHYHLVLRPLVDDGIAQFMKKVNGGYAKYFNEKYGRSGALFQGRYKLVAVTTEAHFIHISYYIHLNPLDLIAPEWRERELRTSDVLNIEKFLERYRWSSYLDYIGKKNFPSVTQRGFLTEFLGGPAQYGKDIVKWLKEMDLERIKDLVLE